MKLVYEGGVVEDKKHGQGKLTYPDGKVYEGDFFEGLQHGQGKLTDHNGQVLHEGLFVKGQPRG